MYRYASDYPCIDPVLVPEERRCKSGKIQSWLEFQSIYYQVMNPWIEDAGIYRGNDYPDNSSPNIPSALQTARRNIFGDVDTWDVSSDILNNGGSHTGLWVSIAGFAPQTPSNNASPLHTLRITIESEHFFDEENLPQHIAGEIRVLVRTPSDTVGTWQTLNITDHDAFTSSTDARRGRHGAWSPDKSIRRTFDFQLRPDQIVDADGRIKLLFLETAFDLSTGLPSDESFVTRFDYVHAMLIPPASTTVGGGEENLMLRGYDPGSDQNIDGEVNSLDIAQFSLDYINRAGAAYVNGDKAINEDDVSLFLDHYADNQ